MIPSKAGIISFRHSYDHLLQFYYPHSEVNMSRRTELKSVLRPFVIGDFVPACFRLLYRGPASRSRTPRAGNAAGNCQSVSVTVCGLLV
jgi:hypothetical protein